MTRSISSTSEHIDVVGGIWSRSANPKSFTVTCNFASLDEEQEEELGMIEEEETQEDEEQEEELGMIEEEETQEDEEQEEELGMIEEEETQEVDLGYDFRALTAEEAADPIAVYILNKAPGKGIQLVDVPAGYHLTGTNTLSGIANDSWTGNKVYLVISDLSGNNGGTAKLYTIMGTGMNQDYTTNGVYLAGAELY